MIHNEANTTKSNKPYSFSPEDLSLALKEPQLRDRIRSLYGVTPQPVHPKCKTQLKAEEEKQSRGSIFNSW